MNYEFFTEIQTYFLDFLSGYVTGKCDIPYNSLQICIFLFKQQNFYAVKRLYRAGAVMQGTSKQCNFVTFARPPQI
jgi:hypothetical protein